MWHTVRWLLSPFLVWPSSCVSFFPWLLCLPSLFMLLMFLQVINTPFFLLLEVLLCLFISCLLLSPSYHPLSSFSSLLICPLFSAPSTLPSFPPSLSSSPLIYLSPLFHLITFILYTCWRINSYQVMPRRTRHHLLSPRATSRDELPPPAYLSA